ncbi:hypothetical protein [Carboxydothermus hydrogenoformans]|uniref:Quinate 5-dehydrogenase n=1 Tax=Carboxydothermus hydrogenoformans (strain ATCC BAA-161 / DSM 6008 / Z-2901) TaxID=246194 RepID=Q3AFB1_CARHZ|nr:hypothetical protein [Carboxydothermus hydrogenoformans]ABB13981.1 conserved hypothetical protein [Carboxydothermus hydrogenoformans Z-2901]
MKRVVSVSLGSSKRDKATEAEFLGEKFIIERRGTDGDYNKALQVLKELDGKVDAIGLGGIDVYLYAGGRRYAIKDGLRLLQAVKITPAVDGSGLKNTLEREVVRELARMGIITPKSKVLLVSAVDRFGMAEALAETGAEVIFGDLIFALGIPIPIKKISTLNFLAAILLPIITKLPFQILYPTGKEQEVREKKSKNDRYYHWADIIAGDYLYIKKHLPERIDGKIILTNTTTREDVEELKAKGAKMLVTTTPVLNGRSFGTNVMEGVLLTLLNKKWEEVTPEDYLRLLKELGFKPNIIELN